MTPAPLRSKIIAARTEWIRRMLAQLRKLPLDDYDTFRSDPRNIAAAESYLRRALEALLDLGRHILAKGFAQPVTEYREIAAGLASVGVLDEDTARGMREMAGYRNRMVHFYHEIQEEELFQIVSEELDDVDRVLNAILEWLRNHPDRIDQAL